MSRVVRLLVCTSAAAACAALLTVSFHSTLANGGKAKLYTYKAEIPLDSDSSRKCLFSTAAYPGLFYLTSVNSKYNVLLVRVENQTKTPLALDKNQDKVELQFETKKISGVLNLAVTDPQTWDSFSTEMREALVYPGQVERGEEEGVYVYIPRESLSGFSINRQMPEHIAFTVASLKKTFKLQMPVAKK